MSKLKEIIYRGVQKVIGWWPFDAPGLMQIRMAGYRVIATKVGKKCIFAHGVLLTQPDGLKGGSLVLGDRVEISPHVEIDYSGGIVIEDDVWISTGVTIETHEHKIDSKALKYDHPILTYPLTIKRDSWIGAKAFINPKVSVIGEGAIVGAHAVVTKDVPDWAIVAGIPAKIIGYRDRKDH